ncbi:MetQ/NlpA family ABC transporter substrate-binding protein [Archaeoglobus veneficus]|uniref:ABC-type transporter, periplasmic subunit family 3 n=1 Tax=Archaeoglobus veneficus (strain DSM 11195 / SNP6) TaxID=693661 RepID=F2KQP6_ARCVS|nr:MetQ/NlpA family ABC transporter substrate-binding protein [Archaeoglobus veneficus]AEA46608.1 ABC-type transporter, periplasmic subunit family 3 [Archaeoglobus veneficus SNP6]
MRWKLIIALLAIAVLFAGCQTEKPESVTSEKATEKVKIRIGLLPIEDTFPVTVAKEGGLFEKYGVEVEIVPFQSALERDAALQAGEIDACIADPLAVILLRNAGYDVRIVSLCLGATPEEGVFAILAAPNSSINSVKDLEGRKIAISSNTIIEYVTDIMLKSYGVENVEKVEIKQIPVRMQTLLAGQVDAATLPEPLASLAAFRGAKLVLSDAMMDRSISQTVIVFRGELVDSKPDAVNAFLKAYGEAAEKINANPESYREEFIEKARIPKDIAENYKMPHYPHPQQYPKEFYEEVHEWAVEKGLLSKEIPYEEAVVWLQ